ncbi:methyltransferase-like protein 25B isoform X2 [Paramormyrops kingsleyae]|uniref:methyltransferase-like protein 25B isoform X2 n=1 Tax=Paramormyrops kingsleyae TaxID=1676925 RepID=UPI000CD65F2C|nr:protein RRNAD1 isoform X2 [Paramormyrops kingsleyae]
MVLPGRSRTLSAEQQRQLAGDLTAFLSQYKYISDSYVIEFFSEDLWSKLPLSWQDALHDLSAPQIADLLLDRTITQRRTPHDQTARDAGSLRPREFQQNQSQSLLLGHIFRKHVKPKKQHEIRRLGMLVKTLCDTTDCSRVVDVGSGQGHLSRFLSFGLGLSVTGIEADPDLVSMASKFDGQLMSTLKKESQKKNNRTDYTLSPPGPSPNHITGWVNPKASWEVFIKQLEVGECEKKEVIFTPKLSKKRQLKSVSKPGQDMDHASRSSSSIQSCCSCQEIGNDMLSDLGCQSPAAPVQDCQKSPNLDLPSSPKRQCMFEKSVSQLSSSTKPSNVEEDSGCLDPAERDVGSSTQSFILTGLHSCGDLSVTLLRHFASCPHVLVITSVACCYMKLTTLENPTPPGILVPPGHTRTEEMSSSEFGYPMSSHVKGLPEHQLSYKAREGACHAIEDYLQRLRQEDGLLRTHCYRAVLEVVIRGVRPDLRRAGIQTIKKAHLLSFSEYARLGLPRVSLPPDLPLDDAKLGALLRQEGRVVVYFSLVLLLAPVVESLVLLDRMLYLQERGLQSQLVPLFDPALSPRNLVLVAVKPGQDSKLQKLVA